MSELSSARDRLIRTLDSISVGPDDFVQTLERFINACISNANSNSKYSLGIDPAWPDMGAGDEAAEERMLKEKP